MKRWAVLTIFLYLLVFTALMIPVTWVCSLENSEEGIKGLGFEELGGFFSELFLSRFGFIVLGILGLCQFSLLYLPVKSSLNIVIKKRHFFVPILAGSLMMAVLFVEVVISFILVIYGDKSSDNLSIFCLVFGIFVWTCWFFIFKSYVRTNDPKKFISRITERMFQGSVLELLIAISCHIWVRRRGDCSAPIGTFVAIAAGLAIALLSFGPSLYWLFSDRAKKMKPRNKR